MTEDDLVNGDDWVSTDSTTDAVFHAATVALDEAEAILIAARRRSIHAGRMARPAITLLVIAVVILGAALVAARSPSLYIALLLGLWVGSGVGYVAGLKGRYPRGVP